ncbi:hypothetical protein D3C76_1853980 [compost metagenome]
MNCAGVDILRSHMEAALVVEAFVSQRFGDRDHHSSRTGCWFVDRYKTSLI